MKKWITLNLCLLLSGFLAGQSENKETQPVKGYEINGFQHPDIAKKLEVLIKERTRGDAPNLEYLPFYLPLLELPAFQIALYHKIISVPEAPEAK